MELSLTVEWQKMLHNETTSHYFRNLMNFIESEYSLGEVFPPKDKIFNAFSFFNPADVKVVILGQDPYHDVNQAHGLCFSVNDGIKIPPSLVNIYKEIEADMGIKPPQSGNLERWAKQGVLLLNATLTVRAHQAGSHQKKGWETFTDAVIQQLAANHHNIVFMLWGSYAQKKSEFIDSSKHLVLTSAHPSPLSAYRGFLGNRHFSTANNYLAQHGKAVVQW